jgi:hypothetical protein
MTQPILRITQHLVARREFIEIGRIVGGLFSRDQRADRNETKRRQKDDATLLHRFKTQDADRARAAAALVSAARTRAETTAPAVELEQEERKNRAFARTKLRPQCWR